MRPGGRRIMENFQCECVVVGAGAVGLAIGRALAQAGRDVVVLEKNPQIGMETSSRNSEVIHAGIYYSKDSLKARLCVRGRDLLYAFCESHGVAHKRLGKLIVATHTGQDEELAAILSRAAGNGVTDLKAARESGDRHAGARTFRDRGAALALHRHHRQPPLYAGAVGGCGKRRCQSGA